jgi:hypothetical protein
MLFASLWLRGSAAKPPLVTAHCSLSKNVPHIEMTERSAARSAQRRSRSRSSLHSLCSSVARACVAAVCIDHRSRN